MNPVFSFVESQIPGLTQSHPLYARALLNACDEVDPPFGQGWYGDKFRECASDLQWLLNQTIINAVRESDGAKFLWELSARVAEPYGEMVRRHAIDESHHARFYVSVLELAFPGALSATFVRDLHRTFPVFKREEQLVDSGAFKSLDSYLDDVVQTTFAEIRTLINQFYMKPVLMAVCPDGNQARLEKLLDTLSGDEVKHIIYTADVIQALGDPATLDTLMTSRLRDFSEVTLEEVGGKSFA